MTKRKRKPPLLWAALTACLAGCFTEVGNADDERLVQAQFSIDYSATAQPLPKAAATATYPESVSILQFYLNVKEAVYHHYDSTTGGSVEQYLWREDSGVVPVDFTGLDTAASLPVQNVSKESIDDFELECTLSKTGSLAVDTVDFGAFKDRSYIKGTYFVNGAVRPFLFALPPAHELKLHYSETAVDSWYKPDAKVYHCQFTFFATKWLAAQPVGLASTWKDETGASVAVFDSTHNAAAYPAMVDAFYKSFNTTKVYVEVGN